MGVSELHSDGLTAVHTQADSPSTPQRGAGTDVNVCSQCVFSDSVNRLLRLWTGE